MLKIGINDKPSKGKWFFYALQQGLLTFAGSLSVSLFFASMVGMTMEETTLIVQCGLFTCMLSTVVQCVGLKRLGIGPRLPIITTCSYTFVTPMALMALDPEVGLAGAFGASLVASFILLLVGPFVVRRLKKYLTPVVSGSVVLSVGLCLMGSAFGNLVSYDPTGPFALRDFLLGMGVFLFAMLVTQLAKGFISTIAVLLAIVVGYIIAIFMGMVDFSSLLTTPVLALPIPFAFGIDFQLGPILILTIVHIATLTENIGDCTNITNMCVDRLPTQQELEQTLRGTAFGSMITAVFNGVPVISGSDNAGLMRLSGVGSRYVALLGGIIVGVMSFFPQVAGVFALLPAPVLGGITIVILGTIAASGIDIINKQKLGDREIIILAAALAMGVGGNYAYEFLSFLPSDLVVLMTGIPGTALVALILEIVLPKPKSDNDKKEEDIWQKEEKPIEETAVAE